MDIFKEDKAIFRRGGLKSAFKWSLLAFPIIFILNVIGILVLVGNILFGLLFLTIFPNVVIFLVYYFALKKGISRFGLTTYSLRVEYVAIITAFIFIFSFLSTLIITGKIEFPRFGILPLIIMLIVPYFVKK